METPQSVYPVSCGCFQLGATRDKVAANIRVQVCRNMLSFLLGKYLEVRLVGHRVGVCLEEAAKYFSSLALQSCFKTSEAPLHITANLQNDL